MSIQNDYNDDIIPPSDTEDLRASSLQTKQIVTVNRVKYPLNNEEQSLLFKSQMSYNSLDDAARIYRTPNSQSRFNSFANMLSPLSPKALVIYAKDQIKPGSMKGAIFTTVIGIVGAGSLALPFAMRRIGLIPGILLLICSALLALFTLDILLLAVQYLPKRVRPSYTTLAKYSCGWILQKITNIIMLVQFFGVAVTYIVAFSGLLQLVWSVSFPTSTINMYPYFAIIVTSVIIFPLGLKKNMSALRFTSLLAFCCSTYLSLNIFIEYFILCDHRNGCFWSKNYKLSMNNLFPIAEGYKSVMEGVLISFPLSVFAFTGHHQMLPVYIELKNRTRNKMNRVLFYSLMITLGLYTLISVFGYLTFLDGTCGNILLNDFNQKPNIIIAAIAISISIILTEPIFAFIFRMNLSILINQSKKWTNMQHLIITLMYFACAVLISTTVSSISLFFGILGNTTYPIIGYIFPAIFFIQLTPKHKYKMKRILAVIQALFVGLISIFSLIYKFSIHFQELPCESVQELKS